MVENKVEQEGRKMSIPESFLKNLLPLDPLPSIHDRNVSGESQLSEEGANNPILEGNSMDLDYNIQKKDDNNNQEEKLDINSFKHSGIGIEGNILHVNGKRCRNDEKLSDYIKDINSLANKCFFNIKRLASKYNRGLGNLNKKKKKTIEDENNQKRNIKIPKEVKTLIAPIKQIELLPINESNGPISNFRALQPFVYNPHHYRSDYIIKNFPKVFQKPIILDVTKLGWEKVLAKVDKLVTKNHNPVIIRGLHKLEEFDKRLFCMDYLRGVMGHKIVNVRNLEERTDSEIKFNEFLDLMDKRGQSKLDQESKAPLLYGKDLEYPPEWEEEINKLIPEHFQYVGVSDFNSTIDKELQIENLMIYVGHGGTYTATHMDMCGSMGHNIMVDAAPDSKALWFMVHYNFRNQARRFFAENGGGNTSVDQDNCLLPIEVMAQADFPIVCFEQEVGDFVLVPSQTIHQVINIGSGYNIKYSWNRNTADSLRHAIREVNKNNQKILKPEIYRTKTMVESAVRAIIIWLINDDPKILKYGQGTCEGQERLLSDFKLLLELYLEIISEEVLIRRPVLPKRVVRQMEPLKTAEKHPYALTCDFCHCDIWNNYFSCKRCRDENGKFIVHDFCVNCFAQGRYCGNYLNIKWYAFKCMDEHFDALNHGALAYKNYIEKHKITSLKPFRCDWDTDKIKKRIKHKLNSLTVAICHLDHYAANMKKRCHHCDKMCYTSEQIKCSECRIRYCFSCITNEYGANPIDLCCLKFWDCFRCNKNCRCSECTQEYNIAEIDVQKMEDMNLIDQIYTGRSNPDPSKINELVERYNINIPPSDYVIWSKTEWDDARKQVQCDASTGTLMNYLSDSINDDTDKDIHRISPEIIEEYNNEQFIKLRALDSMRFEYQKETLMKAQPPCPIPYRHTDGTGTYILNYGLTYFPIDASPNNIGSIVDRLTFFTSWKDLDESEQEEMYDEESD